MALVILQTYQIVKQNCCFCKNKSYFSKSCFTKFLIGCAILMGTRSKGSRRGRIHPVTSKTLQNYIGHGFIESISKIKSSYLLSLVQLQFNN